MHRTSLAEVQSEAVGGKFGGHKNISNCSDLVSKVNTKYAALEQCLRESPVAATHILVSSTGGEDCIMRCEALGLMTCAC